VLADEAVGDAPLAISWGWRGPGASHNSVHHLAHLERYREATGFDVASAGSVVEWGGGYGNLARIVWRLAEARGNEPTYTIVDTPLLCALQWLYLGTVFGEERVCVLEEADGAVREGCLNLVPVGVVERVELPAEVFVSTWALSESSVYAQDLAARRWFGGSAAEGSRLLLAAQEPSAELPDAGRVVELAAAAGAKVVAVPELAGNSYVFR
jgi:hypothetical protein